MQDVSHVWIWELDCEESWALRNWCFWTVVLEKTLESPLDCKEIQPVHPKGNQSWMFIRRTDVEAKIPILWPPDAKNWLIWKDPNAGKDWGQEEKGTTEDELAGWHHWLNGHEFGWTPGVGDGQGGLACCDSWGRKESDTTEQLNWTELNAGCNLISVFNLLTILLILSSIYKEYRNVDILLKSVEIISKRFQQRHIIRTWFLKTNYLRSKVLFSKVKPVGCKTLSSKMSRSA